MTASDAAPPTSPADFLRDRLAFEEAAIDRAITSVTLGPDDDPEAWSWVRHARARCQALRDVIAHETSHRTLHDDKPWHTAIFNGLDGYELYTEHGSPIAAGEAADRLIQQYSTPVTDTPVLRILAATHADHPDYRTEWKP